MKPREGSSAQIRESQDFLGGDQMPAAIHFGKGKSMRRGKTGDVVGRPDWRSSFLGDPGAKFLCGTLGTLQHMKNSLNFVSACLKVVDAHRAEIQLKQSSGIGPKLRLG